MNIFATSFSIPKGLIMIFTDHSIQRMSQRGIKRELIDLVYQYGTPIGNSIELDKKSIQEFINGLNDLKKMLLKVQDKKGICIVMQDNRVITTYCKNKG